MQANDHSYPGKFIELMHSHHCAVFHIVHGLLRDEIAAEAVIRQVFMRARRRLARGEASVSVTLWVYHAGLRFACRYCRMSGPPASRQRPVETGRGDRSEFDLREFVRVLALQPGKIEQHDCELIALRHVLGLSPVQIGRLMRMSPHDISNRLVSGRERLKEALSNSLAIPSTDTEGLGHALSA